jgi:hypothetical protein
MIVTKVEYEIIVYPEWQQKPTYRRFPGGYWEIERWDDHAGSDYLASLENVRMESLLEEEYQAQIEGGS